MIWTADSRVTKIGVRRVPHAQRYFDRIECLSGMQPKTPLVQGKTFPLGGGDGNLRLRAGKQPIQVIR